MGDYHWRFERGKNRKLTMEQAERLRARAWAGEDRGELAREYGVSLTAVSRIKHRQAYWEPGSGLQASALSERLEADPAADS